MHNTVNYISHKSNQLFLKGRTILKLEKRVHVHDVILASIKGISGTFVKHMNIKNDSTVN